MISALDRKHILLWNTYVTQLMYALFCTFLARKIIVHTVPIILSMKYVDVSILTKLQ